MTLFPAFKKKGIFSAEENSRVVQAIKDAERQTSGEIRVYIESRCRFVDPLDRAAEIFWSLKMDQTEKNNSTLLYVAIKDHQFAILADKGIHQQVGDVFWKKEVEAMSIFFRTNYYVDALELAIREIGVALQEHFPYAGEADRNELSDDIVFGK